MAKIFIQIRECKNIKSFLYGKLYLRIFLHFLVVASPLGGHWEVVERKWYLISSRKPLHFVTAFIVIQFRFKN